jgi:hypothetical protein
MMLHRLTTSQILNNVAVHILYEKLSSQTINQKSDRRERPGRRQAYVGEYDAETERTDSFSARPGKRSSDPEILFCSHPRRSAACAPRVVGSNTGALAACLPATVPGASSCRGSDR